MRTAPLRWILAYGIGDERAPVAHAHGHWKRETVGRELRLQRATLLQGDVGQRRAAANRFPVVGHFFNQLG
jgi:hypothetical protein